MSAETALCRLLSELRLEQWRGCLQQAGVVGVLDLRYVSAADDLPSEMPLVARRKLAEQAAVLFPPAARPRQPSVFGVARLKSEEVAPRRQRASTTSERRQSDRQGDDDERRRSSFGVFNVGTFIAAVPASQELVPGPAANRRSSCRDERQRRRSSFGERRGSRVSVTVDQAQQNDVIPGIDMFSPMGTQKRLSECRSAQGRVSDAGPLPGMMMDSAQVTA